MSQNYGSVSMTEDLPEPSHTSRVIIRPITNLRGASMSSSDDNFNDDIPSELFHNQNKPPESLNETINEEAAKSSSNIMYKSLSN